MSDTPVSDAFISGNVLSREAREVMRDLESSLNASRMIVDGQSGVIDELRAINAELANHLKVITKLYDRFLDGDATHENAYYTFYKGEYSKWEAAKAVLAKNKEKPDP